MVALVCLFSVSEQHHSKSYEQNEQIAMKIYGEVEVVQGKTD